MKGIPSDVLNEYLDSLDKKSGFTPKTITLKKQSLNLLSKKLGPRKFTLKNFLKVFQKMKEEGRRDNYLRTLRSSLSGFCHYLKEKGIVKEDFSKGLPSFAAKLVEPEFVEIKVLEKLISLPPRETERYYQRDLMWSYLLELLVKTGLKREEIINLKIGDLDFEKKVIKVRATKVTLKRIIPLPPDMVEELEEWIEERGESEHTPLFYDTIHQGIKRFSGEAIKYEINRRRKELEIKQRITSRTLRNCYIAELLDKNVSIGDVQYLVGHKRPEATVRYSRKNLEGLRKSIRKHSLITDK